MTTETEKKPGLALTEDQKKRQRRRSVALAVLIGLLAVLFYLITIFRMGPSLFIRNL